MIYHVSFGGLNSCFYFIYAMDGSLGSCTLTRIVIHLRVTKYLFDTYGMKRSTLNRNIVSLNLHYSFSKLTMNCSSMWRIIIYLIFVSYEIQRRKCELGGKAIYPIILPCLMSLSYGWNWATISIFMFPSLSTPTKLNRES